MYKMSNKQPNDIKNVFFLFEAISQKLLWHKKC